MNKTILKTGGVSAICTLVVWYFLQIQGCTSAPTTQQSLGEVNTTNSVVASDIGHQADVVDTNVGHVKANVTPTQQTAFGPYFDNVTSATTSLRTDQKTLVTTQAKQIKDAQDAATAEDNKLKDVQNQLATANKAILTHWLAVGCAVSVFVILLGGFFIYQQKYPLGIGMVVGGIADISISILIIQYAFWFAIGGAILLLVGVGFGIYELVKNWKTIKTDVETKTTALHQTIQTAETAKQLLSAQSRKKVFGYGAEMGDAQIQQNPTTRSIVKKIRESGTVLLAVPPTVPSISVTTDGFTTVQAAPNEVVSNVSPPIPSRKTATYR